MEGGPDQLVSEPFNSLREANREASLSSHGVRQGPTEDRRRLVEEDRFLSLEGTILNLNNKLDQALEDLVRSRRMVDFSQYAPAMASPPPPPPPPPPDYGYFLPFSVSYDCYPQYRQYPMPSQPYANLLSASTWSPQPLSYSPPPPTPDYYSYPSVRTTSFSAQYINQSPLTTWNQQPSLYSSPQPQYTTESLLSSWYHQPPQFSLPQLTPMCLQQQEQSVSYVFDEMSKKKETCSSLNCEVLVFDEMHGKKLNSEFEYGVVEEANTKEFVTEELTRPPIDFSEEEACKTLEISLEEIIIVENVSSRKPSEMDSGNSSTTNKLCVVILDTVGPKVQMVNKSEHTIPLEANAFVVLTPRQEKEASSELLPMNFNGLAKAMKPGYTIFIGRYLFTGNETTSVWLEVSELKGDDVVCVINKLKDPFINEGSSFIVFVWDPGIKVLIKGRQQYGRCLLDATWSSLKNFL